MMHLSRLPLSSSFFNDNYFIFFNAQAFPLITNFELCMSCVYVCCLCICNALYLWLYE